MTPQNLPARGKLTPKEEFLLAESWRAVLDPQLPIVTLLGAAGNGKTALAMEVAHRLLEEESFPGGVVWLDCSYTPCRARTVVRSHVARLWPGRASQESGG